jgi:maleylpyruvate isomerase
VKLYTYYRSSAAYRVRIALNLKGIGYEAIPVHLRRGEQRAGDYRAINPQGLVPTLADGETVIAQSLAIIEYLEETHPEPPLLPADPAGRARVRQLALLVACEIHPLNNLKVLTALREDFGATQAQVNAWYRGHVERGLAALETLVAGSPMTGRYCHGEAPTLADLCLVPQLTNARRYDCDLGICPTLVAIDERCRALDAFRRAAPEQQPDAEPE